MAKNPIVTITMKDGGVIKCELYPEIARSDLPPCHPRFHDPGRMS